MLRYLIALGLSLLICAGADFVSLQKLEDRREQISIKSPELTRLAAIDAEIGHYHELKDDLQKRIDLINTLKSMALNEKTGTLYVAILVHSIRRPVYNTVSR